MEGAADTDEADHNPDMGREVADDKDQDGEAEAVGSYRLEDRGDSDRPGERDPSEKISCFVQSLFGAKC